MGEAKNRLDCLNSFHTVVREWFLENVGEPSEPQRKGWPEIAQGKNVLICAPTGSGKTFAAFLKCLDAIYGTKKPGTKNTGVRVLYISPLKALNNDIFRNLEVPLDGIRQKAADMGVELPDIRVAVRTGDTPQTERARMLRNPPDILITTPESLFIMLTSGSYRNILHAVEFVIVDEIHSICANKRGVHLSLSIERLERLAGRPLQRIGLSATVHPLEEAAHFLAGCWPDKEGSHSIAYAYRKVTVLCCDRKRALDLCVNVPVKDFRVLPENTVWPSICSQLLTLIRSHVSTLIFVNNRRTAELVATGINKLAGESFVKTHHGSISKEARHELETQLKTGKIPCLVATSSLEMGIDIGSIDLVVQVGAPGQVSQILQRIGRSGHRLNASSKGRILPRMRGDLLNAAFIAGQAKRFHIESIEVPKNCLDILAQQLVSMVCEGEWDVLQAYRLVKGSYAYRDLLYAQFEGVLEMLDNPSPEDEPGAIKPRVVYDRIANKIRGTALGRKMCLTSGGTIPDKGDFSVYLLDGKTKVGELDEQFIFESRIGDRFFLGSTVWKLEKVEHDKVFVSPSQDTFARIPFWVGGQTMRTYENGLKFGSFLRSLEEKLHTAEFYAWLQEECGLDKTAAENLKQYVADQLAETGYLHNDKQIVCEYFSDETGDRRIIVHTPFGGRIHAALAVILHAKLMKLVNCRVEYIYNDDGILFHILGYVGKLGNLFSLLNRESAEDEIIEHLPAEPLFNMNLRYNLNRALLVETRGFQKRKPLWIQRLRGAQVANTVMGQADHPMVVETYRECMKDILDIGNLYRVIEDIKRGHIRVIDRYTEKPSPFSAELLLNFTQIYMYLGDLPMAERRNQLLVNDREFVQLAVGADAEYELIDPRAVQVVEQELERFKYGRKLADADGVYHFLYSFGELEAEPFSTRRFKEPGEEELNGFLLALEAQGRAMRMEINDTGKKYWIASEDFPLYCKVLKLDKHQYRPCGHPERVFPWNIGEATVMKAESRRLRNRRFTKSCWRWGLTGGTIISPSGERRIDKNKIIG